MGVIVLLFITLFIAPSVKGAGRWIPLGFFSFQPADLAKIVLFIFIAAVIEKKGEEIKDFQTGFLKIFCMDSNYSGFNLNSA